MTWVKSELLRPDGTPIVGQCVTAILIAAAPWLTTGTGQANGTVSTNTDATGLWRLDLLSYVDFEAPDTVFYEIHEGRDMPVWTIRVPPAGLPPIEYWMRDLLAQTPLATS